MSQKKFFIKLIGSLEVPEFDQIAKLYLNEVDGIKNIINCNGPYDSGLDMRNSDASQIETQYQLTIQERKFEIKLFEDLEKAKENFDLYGLPCKVKYFYSYPLSNTVILKYKKDANDKYSIILDIVEANAIAEISSIYDSIGTLLYNLSDLDKYRKTDKFFDDPKVKSFYDLMSFGSSTDIKYNIIKSFVLYNLFQNGPTLTQEILGKVNEHFTSKFDANYFDGFLRRMSTERRIHRVAENLIELTPIEKTRLNELLVNYKDEEALLKKELSDILTDYHMEECIDEIILRLSELYESNYSINLGEFTKRNSNIHDLHTATKQFNDYLKGKLNEPASSEVIAKKIFAIADNNEILSRIAAGQVYSKVSDPERLQEYITRHNNNKNIFLDTNLIINALCVHYNPNSDYDNYHFKVAKQFLNFATLNQLNLGTIKSYAIETASLFKDALAIIPFTKLPIFDKLGGSSNILYTFFQYLKDWGQLHEGTNTFEDFLKEFKFETKSFPSDNNYFSQIEYLLKSLNIEIDYPPKYDLHIATELSYQDLISNSKTKSNFAIHNDAIMLMRLGDNDVEVNPIDPIFCTWDISLFRVRNLFFQEFPSCTKWLMYTPSRLMDQYSMMNFQVKQGTLCNEVLSILDEDFGFQEKTHSLLDSMLIIINPENVVGLQYANKLAELRQQEIIQVDHKPENILEDGSETKSVDIVFQKLFTNYTSKDDGELFDAFKAVFTKEVFFDDVVEILSTEIKSVSVTGLVNNNLFLKMDEIVKKSIELETK